MGEPIRHSSRRLTFSDYRSWPDDERWEVIDGLAYAMGAAPRVSHQKILMELAGELRTGLAGGPCEVLPAPVDLKLSEHDVVQPDILVYCDTSQDKGTHIEGAPALVVEILSPGSQQHDRMRKLHLYARARVSEYWMVSPREQILEVLVLRDGVYSIESVFGPRDELVTPAFPGLRIPLRSIFVAEPYPDQIRESEPPQRRAEAEATPSATSPQSP